MPVSVFSTQRFAMAIAMQAARNAAAARRRARATSAHHPEMPETL
ncbi:MAG: hypothetical protein V4751_11275 [Pseudomonadota bacterium]